MTWWWLIALWIVYPVIQLLSPLAPPSFWSGLYERHAGTACFLWGFTHLFGPRLQDSGWWPEAFENRMREHNE